MKKYKAEYWAKLISHIDDKWNKKMGSPYPFHGKDFRDLKSYIPYYKEWGLMALYDLYLETPNNFVKENGYSLWTFYRQLPKLLDDPNWKLRAQRYEKELCGEYPDKIMELFDTSKFRIEDKNGH